MNTNKTKKAGKKRQKRDALPFKKEDMIALLKAMFRHGYTDLPFDTPTGVSKEEHLSTIKSMFEWTKNTVKGKPSIVDWLNSGLFEDDKWNVPLALLFIELYEQHPSPQENGECDFREIYHFLYKVTTNQPIPYLSSNSAIVLHKLLSELIEEAWPNMRHQLVKYLSKVHIYSRSAVRRTYSGKKAALKRKVKNCLSEVEKL